MLGKPVSVALGVFCCVYWEKEMGSKQLREKLLWKWTESTHAYRHRKKQNCTHFSSFFCLKNQYQNKKKNRPK